MEWMIMPLRRYADFSGRSCRREYWMFALLNVLIIFALTLVIGFAVGFSAAVGTGAGAGLFGGIGGILLLIYGLGIIIPSIAVQVRRFHDQDRSGWMVGIGFIPYIGALVVLVFMCLEGTRGPNQYGPDPLDPYNANVFN